MFINREGTKGKMSENQNLNDELIQFDREIPETPRQKGKTGKLIGLLLTLLILGTILINVLPFLLPGGTEITVSRETTYLTEPLKSDGKRVDYFTGIEAMLYPENMQSDENGARLMVATFGAPNLLEKHIGEGEEVTPDETEKAYALQYYEKLGLDPNLEPQLKFSDPIRLLSKLHDEAVIEWQKRQDEAAAENTEDSATETPEEEMPLHEDFTKIASRPWTQADCPELAGWLEENNEALDVCVEAAMKPVFVFPFVRISEEDSLIALLLQPEHILRTFVRGLSCRANHRIAQGDIDGAIDDVIAIQRIGRFTSERRFLVAALVGIACEGIGNNIGLFGNLEHLPNKEQILRLMNALDHLPEGSTFEENMEIERLTALDSLQGIAYGNMSFFDLESTTEPPKKNLRYARAFNFNRVMKTINGHYDDLIRERKTKDDYGHPLSKPWKMLTRNGRSDMMSNIFSALLLPACEAAIEADKRLQCTRNLYRIHLAMMLYHHDHGTLPPAFSVDEHGKPLHSWRVLLLPYFGEEEKALHEKIRLDQPWDSEENAKLHKTVLAVYQCPFSVEQPGETTYSVIAAAPEDENIAYDAMPFNTSGKGRSIHELGPESADRIFVFEIDDPVCWMNPSSDLNVNDAAKGIKSTSGWGNPDAKITSKHTGGLNVVDRSGCVEFISATLPDELFLNRLFGKEHKLITKEDEE